MIRGGIQQHNSYLQWKYNTGIQTLWKWKYFYPHSVFSIKCVRAALTNWAFLNPLDPLWCCDFKTRHFTTYSCVFQYFKTGLWHWRTVEHSRQDRCTTLTNANKQFSDFTNQNRRYYSSIWSRYPFHPMHNTIILIFHIWHICYILLFLIQWYKGKHILMQSISGLASLYS